VIRLVLENTPRLPLLEVLTAHLARQPQLGDGPALAADLLSFFHDRLKYSCAIRGCAMT